MSEEMKFKEPVIFNLVVFLLFAAMGGLIGIKLFIIYLILYFIPGYIVLHHLGYKEIEKIALAIPVSYSFTILFFLLSRLGIRSINAYGVVILYALLGLFHFRKQIVRR